MGNFSRVSSTPDGNAGKAKYNAKRPEGKPSLTKTIKRRYSLMHIFGHDDEIYHFRHAGKNIQVEFNDDQCYSYKYKHFFDLILKYSTKNNPELTPSEVEKLKKEFNQIPGDVTSRVHNDDNFSGVKYMLMLKIQQAQSEDSDGGKTITVKEQQELLYECAEFAGINAWIKYI